MQITFLGATGTVTGLKYLLSFDSQYIKRWSCIIPKYKQTEQLT